MKLAKTQMDSGNLLDLNLKLQVASSELWINIKQCVAKLQSFNQKNIQCDTTPIIKLSTEEQAAMTKTKGLFGLYVGFTILPILLSWY